MFWLGPKAKTITKLNPNHPHLVCLDSLDGQAWPSFWRHNTKWRPRNAPRSDQSSCKGGGELALQLANHGRSWGCSHCFLASLWEMPENEVKVIWNRYMFDGVSIKRRKKKLWTMGVGCVGMRCSIPHFSLDGWFSNLISYLNYMELLGPLRDWPIWVRCILFIFS